jgi:membrane-bound lytic murein transglycosylase D
MKIIRIPFILIILFFSNVYSNTFENPKTIENVEGVTLHLFEDENFSSKNLEGTHFLEGEKSVWDRIENGFQLNDISNKRVKKYTSWYQSRPEYVERMIDRSSLYLYHVVEEVEKRNMPMEIALLPMIESAYNPIAKSRQKAVGVWQFIPSTGKLFGLEQDWWRDKRRNIIDSTTAALDYLDHLHNLFGSWELALAAYNAGEGRVKRAILRNKKRKLPTDYYSLKLPRETKDYVPKLLAVKKIIQDPEKYQLFIKDIPDKPYFKVVNVPDEIDAHIAAEMANMTFEEFELLNAEHNRPLMKAHFGAQEILLPIENVETFQKNMEGNTEPLTNWITYTPIKGEKVSHVAKKFGINIKELIKINQLRSNQTLKNKIILIPSSPEILKKYPINTDNLYSYSTIVTYKIKSGDTLGTIARKYRISLKDLMEFNELKSSKIIVGKYIDIPQ